MKNTITFLFLISCVSLRAQPCTPNTHSILFNGFSDYVEMPSNTALNITNDITLEAWIYSPSWAFTSDEGSIICKHGWSNGEGGYVLRAGGQGELAFNIAGMDTNGVPTSWKAVKSPANSLTLNTWYHVAGTFDGDSLNLYINGILVNTTLFKGSMVNSPNYNLKIGRLADNQPGIYRYWTGNIDEARVWNRKLSQSEIAANMNTQIDPAVQTGLVGYWRLNDGSGTLVSDLSVNTINGTLFGTGWSTNVPFTTGAPAAVITPSGNTTFCQGNSITLNANSGLGLFYLWSTGATTQGISVNTSGTFTVTVSDTGNCSATSQPVTITVNPVPATPVISFNGTQLICSATSGIQWYLNGNTLFNQVNSTYTPTQNGSYTVIVTSANGCTATSSAYQLTNLSIGDQTDISDIKVHTDPSVHGVQISFETYSVSNTEIQIFDIQGRKITTLMNGFLHAGKHRLQSDRISLTEGTYLLVFRNATGMKQHVFSIIQ